MVEADPFGDIAHPEDIGAEMRETRQKSCRGMPVMLCVLSCEASRKSCLPSRYVAILAFICTVA